MLGSAWGWHGAPPAWPPLPGAAAEAPGAGRWALLRRRGVSASRPWSAATGAIGEGGADHPVGLTAGRLALAVHLLGLGRPVTGPPRAAAERWWQRDAGKAELESLTRAVSLVQQEAVTFLGGVPAHIFLSQIRVEACQEIQSEPAMLLLSVPALRALQVLLPLSPSWGLPPSCPGPHVSPPGPQLLPQGRSPAPHSPAMGPAEPGPPVEQKVIKETTAKNTVQGVYSSSVSPLRPHCFPTPP